MEHLLDLLGDWTEYPLEDVAEPHLADMPQVRVEISRLRHLRTTIITCRAQIPIPHDTVCCALAEIKVSLKLLSDIILSQ